MVCSCCTMLFLLMLSLFHLMLTMSWGCNSFAQPPEGENMAKPKNVLRLCTCTEKGQLETCCELPWWILSCSRRKGELEELQHPSSAHPEQTSTRQRKRALHYHCFSPARNHARIPTALVGIENGVKCFRCRLPGGLSG